MNRERYDRTMKKFLLIGLNSKYIHMNPAVYSLRAYACEKLNQTAQKVVIDISEYTINQSMEEILMDIYMQKPDVVGFSCYIWNWRMIRELMVELKKILPDTDIFLGGPEVSYEAEQLIQEFGCHTEERKPVIRGIIVGEGEKTFTELVQAYAEGKEDFSKVAGLLLETGFTGEREALDFDEVPFLYGNISEDKCSLEPFRNKIIYYESARGCPFRCSYCLSSIDKTIRLRSLKKVLPELQFFLDEKVPQVKFIDRTFNGNKQHAMTIWNYLVEHDNGITNFHFEIAAELIGEEELALFRKMRPGLIQLEIGVQTTNEQTLKEINRKSNWSHLVHTVTEIQKGKNIHIHLDLIAGLPKEDYQSFVRSFNQVYGLQPEQLQLGFLKVLKGTQISARQKEYGLAYESNPPYEVLFTNWISYEEIRNLKQVEEMVETYYNSNQFTYTIKELTKVFCARNKEKGAFGLFEKLAEYYVFQGYFLNTPARARRYDVLLEFACSHFPENTELWKELLTYDYYLRENAKSRPDFCKNLSEDYDKIWEFYKKEEKDHHYLAEYSDYHARQMMKMTHMEIFTYSVWSDTEPQKKEHPIMVLFDYQKKSPLTGEAKTYCL